MESNPESKSRWHIRRDEIGCDIDEIEFPDSKHLDQDEEWCEIQQGEHRERIRFHDYDRVYRVPGLYEKLFYEKLQCNSPHRVVGLLSSVLKDFGIKRDMLRVLDIGAGNGMVGEEFRAIGAEHLVGIDIIPEAKDAALRDRPEVYNDYLVADLTDLEEADEKRLRRANLNALSVVAALGFGDIPAEAFIKAADLIETPGWLAFNIKEDFLAERDSSGFSRLIRQLNREEVIQIQAYRRYQHRLAVSGKPLYYVAMVAKKLRDLPDDLMQKVS